LPDLEKLIRAVPKTSGLDLHCEACQSEMRKYIHIEVKSPFVTAENIGGQIAGMSEPAPALSLRVCVVCYVRFMAYLNNVAMEYNARP
jgi:hypothetical protein